VSLSSASNCAATRSTSMLSSSFSAASVDTPTR
jgi:hypothetical protein